MNFRMSVLLVGFCVADVLGLPRVPRQVDFLSEIDNLSDESSDILFQPTASPTSDSDEKPPPFPDFGNVEGFGMNMDLQTSGPVERPPLPLFEDPKVYGMNIGLHFLLESINRKVVAEERVHLESMIKVLVMVHNIEKVGGTLNDNNKIALKRVAKLYPAALREAIAEAD